MDMFILPSCTRAAPGAKSGVIDLLEGAGLGLPKYYAWRTRSGCTFCFFQQKIEWVRLMEQHPEAFEEAKRYEKCRRARGPQGMSEVLCKRLP